MRWRKREPKSLTIVGDFTVRGYFAYVAHGEVVGEATVGGSCRFTQEDGGISVTPTVSAEMPPLDAPEATGVAFIDTETDEVLYVWPVLSTAQKGDRISLISLVRGRPTTTIEH